MRGLTPLFPLLLSALFVLLPGCASNPRVQVLLPPATLYSSPCSNGLIPRAGEVFSNGALLSYSLDAIVALRACDADRDAIRKWAEANSK